MKKKIILEIENRIKSIKRRQKLTPSGYYQMQLSGQVDALEYLRNWIVKQK